MPGNFLAGASFTSAQLQSAQQGQNHPLGQGAVPTSVTSSLEASLLGNLQCSICHEPFRDPVVTPYGNTFCRQCVTLWLEQKTTCPTTRRPLHVQQLAPNYQIKQVLDILQTEKVPEQDQNHPLEQGAASALLTSSLESSLLGNLQCSICHDLFKDPVVTPYGNTFCRQCVTLWLEQKNTCPTTRRPLLQQQLAPNYQIKQVLDILQTRNMPRQVFDQADSVNESSTGAGSSNTVSNQPSTSARLSVAQTSRSSIPLSPLVPQRAATPAVLIPRPETHDFLATSPRSRSSNLTPSPIDVPRQAATPAFLGSRHELWASPVQSPPSTRSQLTFAEASPVSSPRSSLIYAAMAAALRREPAPEPCIVRRVCRPDPVCVPSYEQFSSRSARSSTSSYAVCSAVERSEPVTRSSSSRSGGCHAVSSSSSSSSSSVSTRRIDIRGLGPVEVHKGPRGGEWYYNRNGNKSYVKQSQKDRIY